MREFSSHFGRAGTLFLVALKLFGLSVPLSNLLTSNDSALHVPDYLVTIMGKYLCYAIFVFVFG